MDIHHHYYGGQSGKNPFTALSRLIDKHMEGLMAVIEELRSEVDAQGTVIASAVTLIEGMAARLDEALASDQIDRTALEAMRDDLRGNSAQLAAAVAANTPAAEEPAPEPTPEPTPDPAPVDPAPVDPAPVEPGTEEPVVEEPAPVEEPVTEEPVAEEPAPEDGGEPVQRRRRR